jgi:tripartite-type tricarboxylate transporter receptor subunit TctC
VVLEEVSRQIGQSIVVENRPGASGTIGANAVAKAAPDGYTILVHSSSHTVVPSTFTKLPYSVEQDFTPVAALANIPNVVVANPKKGYKTLQDLVDDARRNPGRLNYASAGVGSATHLAVERLKQSAGIEAQHVPFKGSSEALTEVIAERIDFYAAPVNTAVQFIKEGQLTALAVSSARRAAALPDVPTTIEAGLRDSDYEFWIGAFLPGQTSKEIVDRLHAAIFKALATPGLEKRFHDLGAEPMKMSPEQFKAQVRREVEGNAVLVKAAGIKPN